MQINLRALADYVENTLDCDPEYEADEFAFDFEGKRIYCERRRNWFNLYVEQERFQLPR